MKLSKEASQLRREYMRAWFAKHPGRKTEYDRRYWEKKARQAIQIE
jgi:hypothetical protein